MSLLLIVLVACGGAGGADSSVTTPPAVTSTPAPLSTTVEPSTSTTVAPTTTLAPDAAPPEIRGQWISTDPASGGEVNLMLGTTSFTIDREDVPGQGGGVRTSGKISVEGDTIEFSLGESCQGSGSYTWALEGEMLTFALQGVDECGRSVVLDGITYTFVAPLP